MGGKIRSVIVAYSLHDEFGIPLVEIAAMIADKSLAAFNVYSGARVFTVSDIHLGDDGWDDLWMECARWDTQDYDQDCVDRLFNIERWKHIGLNMKNVADLFGIRINKLAKFAYVPEDNELECGVQCSVNEIDLDKNECISIARALWEKDGDLTQLRIAVWIHEDKQVFDDSGAPLKCAWRGGKKAVSTIRAWISGADPTGRKKGRPAKRRLPQN